MEGKRGHYKNRAHSLKKQRNMPQSDKILKAKNWRCYLVLKHIYIKEMRVLKHTNYHTTI